MPIFLDVHAPHTTEAKELAALLDSCSEAISDRCEERVPGSDNAPDAIVEWQGEALDCVRVWAGNDAEDTDYQELCFTTKDLPVDRFVATGLMVGALYKAKNEPIAEPRDLVKKTNGATPQLDDSTAQGEPPATRKYFEVLALVGVEKGFDARVSTRLEVGLVLPSGVEFKWGGGLGTEPSRPFQLSMNTAETYLHLGYRFFVSDSVSLGLGIGPTAQWVQVGLKRGTSYEEGATFRSGLDSRLSARWTPDPSWFLEVRLRGVAFTKTPQIFVEQTAIANLPAFEGGLQLGGGFAF